MASAITVIYTLSLHDALPIFVWIGTQLYPDAGLSEGDYFGTSVAVDGDTIVVGAPERGGGSRTGSAYVFIRAGDARSEEHTSELQSQSNLVCRLLLEKKKNII